MPEADPSTDQLRSYVDNVPRQLYLDGRFIDSADAGRLTTWRPATGTQLATVACAGPTDVDRAVRAARRALEPGSRWRRMTPASRTRLLHRIGELITSHADDLALLECLDNGKPLSAARHGDVPAAADVFHYMAGWPGRLAGQHPPLFRSPPERYLAHTRREPVGVVAAIAPWNFPLYMAAAKLAPALAAGCPVILKPAEHTPLSALMLARLLHYAGVPPGAVSVLPGGPDTGEALAAHPGVDKVAFTGSTEVGQQIVRVAAGDLRRVSLELGGKSPGIIFADANLDEAIEAASHAIFYNQGETCVAGSRLYVQRPIFDKVASAIRDRAAAVRLGDGLDRATAMGPLISAAHRERVLAHVRHARELGGQVSGGEVPPGAGYFCTPAVITGLAHDAAPVQTEIFGPVLSIHPFDHAEQAVQLANDSPYGLAAGVFTGDLAKAYHLSGLLKAGTVWINSWHVLDPALPFGGMGASGWGREMGWPGVEAYLETKTVLADIGSPTRLFTRADSVTGAAG